MEKKIFQAVKDFQPVVEVSTRHATKFSVAGTDGTTSFVSLTTSSNVKMIRCLRAGCRALMGGTRSHKRLMSLIEDTSLCPHLTVMKANQGVWENSADVSSPDGNTTVDGLPPLSEELEVFIA